MGFLLMMDIRKKILDIFIRFQNPWIYVHISVHSPNKNTLPNFGNLTNSINATTAEIRVDGITTSLEVCVPVGWHKIWILNDPSKLSCIWCNLPCVLEHLSPYHLGTAPLSLNFPHVSSPIGIAARSRGTHTES